MSTKIRNKDYILEVNSDIKEYDIKSANTSLSLEYHLLPASLIKKINSYPDTRRKIIIGKLMRKNKDFSKNLEKSFDIAINSFKENNAIETRNIISINKDAIFLINHNVINNKVGEHIIFRIKNQYHAYLYLKPFQFFFKNENEIHVKGLQKESIYHKNGILLILREFIHICENYNMDEKKINLFLKDLVLSYKNRDLTLDCYREFNSTSCFVTYDSGLKILHQRIEESDIDEIDISYNYINIILPLYNLFN